MDSLPEFFSGLYPSKTPEIYKEYREFIIATGRMQPETYLTATVCRRHLSGDACAIIRVHSFLEMHGLINFSAEPDHKPLAKDLLKEVGYNKVFINAANKHFLEKNENEYLSNLLEVNSIQTSADTQNEASSVH